MGRIPLLLLLTPIKQPEMLQVIPEAGQSHYRKPQQLKSNEMEKYLDVLSHEGHSGLTKV